MMKKSLRLLLITAAALVCAIAVFCLIFTGKGYHSFLSWHNFNLDGSCMIYDVEKQSFLEDSELHIHVFRREKEGEDLTKGQFVIGGLLDQEKLNREAGENIFYTQTANYDSLNGQPGLYYKINRYETQGTETQKTEEIEPKAELRWQPETKTALIKLAFGEQYDEDVRYIVFYGFSEREAAKKYAEESLK